MLVYEYTIFLRCSKTGETQHGTFEVDSEVSLSFGDLLKKIEERKLELDFKFDYTLIGIQIISVRMERD